MFWVKDIVKITLDLTNPNKQTRPLNYCAISDNFRSHMRVACSKQIYHSVIFRSDIVLSCEKKLTLDIVLFG